MVLLLNYLSWLVGILALYMAWKARKFSKQLVAIILAVAIVALFAIQASVSYTPKGQPQRTQLEQFEAEELEMQDRLRKNELSPAERGEHINSRLDAIDKLNKRKEEQQ